MMIAKTAILFAILICRFFIIFESHQKSLMLQYDSKEDLFNTNFLSNFNVIINLEKYKPLQLQKIQPILLLDIFLFQNQRPMNNSHNTLLRKIQERIKQYKQLKKESGFSQKEVLHSLARTLQMNFQKESIFENIVLFAEQFSKKFAQKSQSKTYFSQVLSNLQVAINQLKNVDSQEEEDEKPAQLQEEKREKGKKKQNPKKKGKKGKHSAIEQIQAQAQAKMSSNEAQIYQSLKNLHLIKSYLEKRVLSDMCNPMWGLAISQQVFA